MNNFPSNIKRIIKERVKYRIMSNLITPDTKSRKKTYFWNTCASFLNTCQTVIILMVISRIDPVNDAGIFSIAYAIANLMVMIGRYGIRQYQASDVLHKYSFYEYLCNRVITVCVMFFVFLIQISYSHYTGEYSSYKSICVFLICLVRLIDAVEDVFHGMFQQQGYLNVAAQILSVRYIVYIIVYIVSYLLFRNLILATCISVILIIPLTILLNRSAWKDINIKRGEHNFRKSMQLLFECFPLFLSTYFSIYLGNAPKYAIDKVMSNEMQAEFNYIFMPVFVITLMSMFIYQPLVVKFAELWAKKRTKIFCSLIAKQAGFLSILTAITMLGASIAGIPVLSFVFGVDLQGYNQELVILMLGGGMLALVNFLTMVITVLRGQKYMVIGYAICYVLFQVNGESIVVQYGIKGISIFYTGCMLCLALFCTITILINIIKLKKKDENGYV